MKIAVVFYLDETERKWLETKASAGAPIIKLPQSTRGARDREGDEERMNGREIRMQQDQRKQEPQEESEDIYSSDKRAHIPTEADIVDAFFRLQANKEHVDQATRLLIQLIENAIDHLTI